MRLVDTSAWIEILSNSATGKLVRAQVPPFDQWIVPTIVQHELMKWILRELGPSDASETLALSNTCIIVPLHTSVAVAAAVAGRAFRLATADAIIYATAQAHGADLLTCDAHFKDLADVVYIPKSDPVQ